MTVDRSQVSVRIGPFVPDGHLMVMQVFDIGIPLDKPQQFVYNRAQMDFLRSQKGETLRKVKSHLIAENGLCAGTRPVGLHMPVLHDMLQKLQILLHEKILKFLQR